MSRIAYINGVYTVHEKGMVSIDDRGYQFSDGVYEVVCLYNGHLIDEKSHLDRLERSLEEIHIASPYSRHALQIIIREVIRRNRLKNGYVYLQMTRGIAPRDHQFPDTSKASLVVTARFFDFQKSYQMALRGGQAISHPDHRWRRKDIKSISLLANVLAKQSAIEQGADEAILVSQDGYITEGSSTNFWIVVEGQLWTHPATCDILKGITRLRLMTLAEKEGIPIKEKRFTLQEALDASEAFTSSSIRSVQPIVTIDHQKIGTGCIGPLTSRLLHAYQDFLKQKSHS